MILAFHVVISDPSVPSVSVQPESKETAYVRHVADPLHVQAQGWAAVWGKICRSEVLVCAG